MTMGMAERHRLALLGWVATVATSLSLFPTLQEKRFVLVGALVSGIAVGVGVLWRHFHLPIAVAPFVQLLVVAEVLVVTYGGHTLAGVVPTSDTFATLNNRINIGMDMAQRFAAPVPHSPGLTLMLVAFIAVVAIGVDLLAAGITRAPLAGLPLLTLYSVPVASLPHGVPAVAFVPGAAAYLALLMVAERERLGHWGRHVAQSSRDAGEPIDTSGLAATGRRVSVAAIAAAVALPILVPGFGHQLFRGSGGLGNGDGPLSFSDPMVSLAEGLHQKDPVDLVDVMSPTPPSYLRLAVLNKPGPLVWRNSGVSLDSTIPPNRVLPAPGGLSGQVAQVPRAMDITLEDGFPNDSAWLPVPYDMGELNIDYGFGAVPEDFAYIPSDETVTAATRDAIENVHNYSIGYSEIRPTPEQLANAGPAPADIITQYGSVPAGVPAVIGSDARQITAGATNSYEAALKLQSFFRDGHQFTYDLHAGFGYGYRAMVKFLQARRGFCQHFAATMAMMAREIGIPSRVVVGFLNPSHRDSDGGYVFTSHDAHSWPELYFGGIGWVRFEPTPGNGAVIPGWTHTVSIGHIGPTKPTPSPGGINGHVSNDVPTTTAPVVNRNHHRAAAAGGGVPSLAYLGIVVVLLLLLVPSAIRLGLRRSRLARAIDGGESCEYAWLELRDRIVDLRLPWSGSLTPRARQRFVEPLLGGDPDAVRALDRLSLTVERSRYAATPLPDAAPAEDAREILRAINEATDRKRRVKAFLWPSSLMPEVRLGWSHLRSRLRRTTPAEA